MTITLGQKQVVDRQIEILRNALGPVIKQALEDPDVVEVIANSDGKLWVERLGSGMNLEGELSAQNRESVIRLIANHVGEIVTNDHPSISGTIPGTGERFQGMVSPIVESPSFAIRKRPQVVFTIEDYVRDGVMNADQAQQIEAAAEARQNILILGGTGSGKTTLANAILALEPLTRGRIILIEDTPELQCLAQNKLHLYTKRTDPPKTMNDLIRDSLRLRPDRIIVGEVRGGEALSMIKAWNTGHPGGIATAHANSAEDGLRRIEEMIGEIAANIPHQSIASAIDMIVFISRDANNKAGRTVQQIVRVIGYKQGAYEMNNR